MGPVAAISATFRQYADFRGRSSRPQFWWFAAFCIVALTLAAIIDDVLLNDLIVLFTATMAGLFVPFLAVTVRRLRDANLGWAFVFLYWVPVLGHLVLAVLLAQPTSTAGVSRPGVPAPARR